MNQSEDQKKKRNKDKKFEKDSFISVDETTWNQIKANYGLVEDVFKRNNFMISVVGKKKENQTDI